MEEVNFKFESEISAIFSNFCDDDIDEVASQIKEIPFVNEYQFEVCVKIIAQIAFEEPELSLKCAKLSKKLESFSLSPDIKVESASNFKDALLKFLHHQFEELLGTPTINRILGKTTFIGNLFNVNILSGALLRYWISGLIKSTNNLPLENLLKVIQSKVREDYNNCKSDIYLSSIMETIEAKGIKDEPDQKEDERQNLSTVSSNAPQANVVQEGAWNLQTLNESSVSSVPEISRICINFQNFLPHLQTNNRLRFDVKVFKTCSESERLTCAKLLYDESILNFGNVKPYVDIVQQTLKLGMKSKAKTIRKSFVKHLTEVYEAEMKMIVERNKKIDLISIAKSGALICELYNLEIIKTTWMKSWMENVLKNLSASREAVLIILPIVNRIWVTMKKRDPKSYSFFVDFINKIGNDNNDMIRTENPSDAADTQSDDSSSLPNEPAANIQFPKEFTESIEKIKTNQITQRDIDLIAAFNMNDYKEFFFQAAVESPEYGKQFANFASKLPSFKNMLFAHCKREFRKLETGNVEDIEGKCKFVGEMYNVGLLTNKKIHKFFKILQKNSDVSERGCEILRNTIYEKAVAENENLPFLKSTRNISLPSEAQPESEAIKAFRHFLTSNSQNANYTLNIDVVEIFKVSSAQDRQQFASELINFCVEQTERTKDLAKFCHGCIQSRVSPGGFKDQMQKQLAMHLQANLKSTDTEDFWSKVVLYGTFIGECYSINAEYIRIIKLWLDLVFNLKDSLRLLIASESVTFEELREDFQIDDEHYERFLKFKAKLFADFTWLHSLLVGNSNADLTDRPDDDDTIEYIPRKTSPISVICNDFRQYLKCIKVGITENVFFDFRRVADKNEKVFISILDFSLKDIGFAKAYAIFVDEMRLVKGILAHFVRLVKEHVDDELNACIDEVNIIEIDWNRFEKLAYFLCELYNTVDMASLKLFNTQMLKVQALAIQGNDDALKVYLMIFDAVQDVMKKRDLKEYEQSLNYIEQISLRADLPENLRSEVQRVMRKYQEQFTAADDSASKVSTFLEFIKSGKLVRKNLLGFSTFELKELAKRSFEEVSANPESTANFANGFKSLTAWSTSSTHIFNQQVNVICENHFDTQNQKVDENIEIAISNFIGELYNVGYYNHFWMNKLLNKLNLLQHDNSSISRKFNVLKATIRKQVDIDYEAKKDDHTHSSLYAILHEHGSPDNKFSNDEENNQNEDDTSSGAIRKRLRETSNESSNTSASDKLSLRDFSEFLEDFSNKTAHDLDRVIEDLKGVSTDEFEEYVEAFYNAVNRIQFVTVIARIAQSIEDGLRSARRDVSFREALVKLVVNSLSTLSHSETACEQTNYQRLANFTGELYNISWFSDHQLVSSIENLTLDNFGGDVQIMVLHELMKTVGMKMIKDKRGANLKVCYDILSYRVESIKEIQHRFMCLETLRILEDIQSTCGLAYDINPEPDDIESLLKSLSNENSKAIANKIQSKEFQDDNEFYNFVSTFINIAIINKQNGENYSKLACNIKFPKFKNVLLNELQQMFLQPNFNINLIAFIGELYNAEYVDNDYINLVLDVMFAKESSNESAVDCIETMFSTAGAMMRTKNKEKLDKYFKFFKYIANSEKQETYRSKVYNEMIPMYEANLWIMPKQNSIQPSILIAATKDADSLNQRSENWLDRTTVINDPKKCLEKLIRDAWAAVRRDEDEIPKHIEMFKAIADDMDHDENRSNFKDKLEEFLKEDTDVSIHNDDNANKIMFVVESFKQQLITVEVLSLWIQKFKNEFKLLPLRVINHISSSIGAVESINQNIELTAILIKLEDIASEKSDDACSAIKYDINELTQFFQDLNNSK